MDSYLDSDWAAIQEYILEDLDSSEVIEEEVS